MVGSWLDESAVPQSACAAGSIQRRGPGRRKKQFASSDVMADDAKDTLSDLCWRSGKLSKLVFQRGTLPCSVLRKAARQGTFFLFLKVGLVNEDFSDSVIKNHNRGGLETYLMLLKFVLLFRSFEKDCWNILC